MFFFVLMTKMLMNIRSAGDGLNPMKGFQAKLRSLGQNFCDVNQSTTDIESCFKEPRILNSSFPLVHDRDKMRPRGYVESAKTGFLSGP